MTRRSWFVACLLPWGLALAACSGGGDTGPAATPTGPGPTVAGATTDAAGVTAPAPELRSAPTVDFDPLRLTPPITPGTSPEDAAARFVAAEAAGDDATAFGLLVAGEREALGSPARWRSALRHRPRLRSFTATVSRPLEGGEVEVLGTVGYEAAIDEVLGQVPATAEARWVVAPEDGGWRVAHGRSRFVPSYPPNDRGAGPAVAAWASSRQRCEPSGEYVGGIAGSPGLADRLCQAPGPVAVEAPRPLSPVDASALVAAFGAEAQAWGRVVTVTSPVRLAAVVAPVGDAWVVVGVFPAEA